MDKQAILNGSFFTLGDCNERKFQLKFENWNDFGYYTLYGLWMYISGNISPFRIADIRVMNCGQKKGDKPSGCMPTPITFISNIESAERLFLLLSPKERKNLETELLIHYDDRFVKDEPVFLESVLRGKTLEDFHSIQEQVHNLMSCDLDISTMIDKNKSQLKRVFSADDETLK